MLAAGDYGFICHCLEKWGKPNTFVIIVSNRELKMDRGKYLKGYLNLSLCQHYFLVVEHL